MWFISSLLSLSTTTGTSSLSSPFFFNMVSRSSAYWRVVTWRWIQAVMLGAGAGGCQMSTSATKSRVAQLNMIHSTLRRPHQVPGVKIGTTCLTDTSIHPCAQCRGICIIPSPFFGVVSSSFSPAFCLTVSLLKFSV
jgi:hypothetical protein